MLSLDPLLPAVGGFIGLIWSPCTRREGLQQRLDASVAWIKDGEFSRWKRKSFDAIGREGERLYCTVVQKNQELS
jgi:hypothetical protein